MNIEQKYKYMDFNTSQIRQIKLGIESSLTEEQIQIYAKPEFSGYEMEEIRWGLEDGFDVSIYANSKYDWEQMSQVREGLQNGLTVEQIKIYAKTEFNQTQMEQIRYGLQIGLKIDKVQIYANSKFDWTQMMQIRMGLEQGLDILKYANPKLTSSDMEQIRLYLLARKRVGLDGF